MTCSPHEGKIIPCQESGSLRENFCTLPSDWAVLLLYLGSKHCPALFKEICKRMVDSNLLSLQRSQHTLRQSYGLRLVWLSSLLLFGFQQLGLADFGVYLFVTGECAAYTGIVWGSITITEAAVEAEVATLWPHRSPLLKCYGHFWWAVTWPGWPGERLKARSCWLTHLLCS